MDTSEAKELAVSLMCKHALVSKGWSFQFDESVRRFGLCSYRTKTISLSRTLVELNPIEQVRDTILHEVAHALAGPTAKHGTVWKLMANQSALSRSAAIRPKKLGHLLRHGRLYANSAIGLSNGTVCERVLCKHGALVPFQRLSIRKCISGGSARSNRKLLDARNRVG